MFQRWFFALIVPVGLMAVALAVPPEAAKQKSPGAVEADQAAQRARVEGGLKISVWAHEPLLANPVAFTFDEKGRCYVAETYRHTDGVTDTRGHMYWLEDDIGCRTVADRLAMYAKHKYPKFEQFGEIVRQVWDSNGDGVADQSSEFAGPFNKPEDGVAAGVLARKGDVYFACIPSLYRLRDADGDHVAERQNVMSTGYGVRVQFIGHDLHGLIMGPDGKLYFSIGDRGFTVETKEGKTLSNPDSGAVLRCELDGTDLEIVHIGLRNPQELVFDDHGNLFTYDNNSDSGDQARWVQIVEGGDSGWRCGYQYGSLMHHDGVPQGNRGPWNTEKIWHVPGPDGTPPAYVVPPILHFGNGPSGIDFYPGVGLSDRYNGHFFACDFTANPGNSFIWSLAVKPKGASFEIVDLHKFVSNMVPTDCEFGPDGAFYWLDWTGGWNKPAKGRIFRVADDKALAHPAIKEAQNLLAAGLGKKSIAELVKLLEHPHRKVRQESQYELALRGGEALAELTKVAWKGTNQLARLHAIWGMAQMARTQSGPAVSNLAIVNDPDSEIRVQVARTDPALSVITKLLTDPDARVRFNAIQRYGQLAKPGDKGEAYQPLFEALKTNNNQDAYLRHAAAAALARMTEVPCDLLNAFEAVKGSYDTPAVRLGVVLALRKLQCRRLGEFLTDSDPEVVAEAARAIYDQELMVPMEALAKLADRPGLPEPVAYRALAANAKLGGTESAARIANFAARSSEPDHLRACALKLLASWGQPKRLDPITGLRQEPPTYPATEATEAVKPVLEKLFVGSDQVRKEAVQVTAKLAIKEVGSLMAGLVGDDKQSAGTRVDALFALADLKAPELTAALGKAMAATEPRLRAAARVVKANANPQAATTELTALLGDPQASIVEKQMALGVMGTLPTAKSVDNALATALDQLAAGQLPPELKLDVLEAAQARSNDEKIRLQAPLRQKLRAIDQAARAASEKDPLARYREALAGGEAERGRQIFLNNAAVYCQRCHKLDGQGGDVGPAVNGLGAKHPPEYLLESIVYPNTKIAEGYQSVILTLIDGRSISGVLRAKDAKTYTLVTPENKVLTIPRDDVDGEKPDQSAMPEDLIKKLSKRELRDLVAFLASLKDAPK